MKIFIPQQFFAGLAFGTLLRTQYGEVMGGRDPEIDHRLLGGTVLRLFEQHGWELVLVKDEVEVRKLPGEAPGAVPLLCLREYARGAASALRAEVATGLAPYTCPSCDARAVAVPGLLCPVCAAAEAL